MLAYLARKIGIYLEEDGRLRGALTKALDIVFVAGLSRSCTETKIKVSLPPEVLKELLVIECLSCDELFSDRKHLFYPMKSRSFLHLSLKENKD